MCRYCDYIPFSEFKEHLETHCPYRKSCYCSFCSVYGHPESDCPCPPPEHFRKPEYVEQLLPSHLVKSYNISTATPLPTSKPTEITRYDVIELTDSVECIKRYLLSVIGGIPSKAREDDLRRRLAEYAKKHNKMVLFVPPSSE
jgi:hypothetical protein